MAVREQLSLALSNAARSVLIELGRPEAAVPQFSLMAPPRETHETRDELTSDLPVELGRELARPVAEVAEALLQVIATPNLVRSIEITRSGFLRFRLSDDWTAQLLQQALSNPAAWGNVPSPRPERIHLEFVSADPTGPLGALHGREAAFGATLASILRATGHQVLTEYYVNDAGGAPTRFAEALSRRLQDPASTAGSGEFRTGFLDAVLAGIAPSVGSRDGSEMDPDLVRHAAAHWVANSHQRELAEIGVEFDRCVVESELLGGDGLSQLLTELMHVGRAYQSEGATWLRTSQFGDVEDRPLLRSNGRPSYLAGDLLYHRHKFRQDVDRVIDIWGHGHAGYVTRTRAAARAMGFPEDRMEILLIHPVVVLRDGMSVGGGGTAPGVTLHELLASHGRRALRLAMISQPADRPLEIDLDGACQALNLLDQAVERTVGASPSVPARPTVSPLLRLALDLPDVLAAAGRERDPYRLCRYATELADTVVQTGDGMQEAMAMAGVSLRTALRHMGIDRADA